MVEVSDLSISTSKEFFNEMKEEIIVKGVKSSKFIFSNDADKIKKLVEDLGEGDVILLENRIDKKIIDILND
jgi:hypothetical protein